MSEQPIRKYEMVDEHPVKYDTIDQATKRRTGPLTTKELEVLELASMGWANKVIAAKLGYSRYYLRVLWSYILAKLGADNRTHAVANAIRQAKIN